MKIDRPIFMVNIEETNYLYEINRINDGLKIKGQVVLFVEFDENGRAKALHEKPELGFALIVDKTPVSYKWMTSEITEVVSFLEKSMQFKTKNSEYVITKIK